jgi:hypothetical protein
MKKYLLSLLTLLVILSSCEKEDDILTPITQPTQTNTTNTTNTNGDTTTNVLPTTYKLVKCTYDYIDDNNPSNNISYFGNPYDEYGTTTDFIDNLQAEGYDTLMVNMPMYPVWYMPQPTEPLYFNGEPEWFILTVKDFMKTDEWVDATIDMRRVLCPATITDLQFRFFITENNGVLTLTLTDQGNNWTTIQTMRFEPM